MALSSSHLEAFLAASQLLSFTRAAQKLGVTQSALSQRILNLEEELGTTLFVRERSGILLTETARELLRYCNVKDSLESEFLSKLKTRSQSELVGIARIAGFSSVMRSLVLPALTPLFEKHKQVKFELKIRETGHLLPLLIRGEVDFVVIDQKVERSDLEILRLGSEKNVLVEKKGYAGPDVFLDHDECDQTTLNYFKLHKKRNPKIDRRYLDDIYGVLDGTRLGLGRAILPRHLLLNQNDLRILSPEVVLETPVYLAYFKQPYYSRLHESLVAIFEKGIGL